MRNTLFKTILWTLGVFLLAGTTFGQTSGYKTPIVRNLLNDLPVLLWRDSTAQKVSVSLRLHSGAEFDRIDKEGTMLIMTEVMFPDNGLEEDFRENLGGSLAVRHGFDYIQIDATADSDNLLEVVDYLAAAVKATEFSKATTKVAKESLIKKINAKTEYASYVSDLSLMERLYG